MSSPPEMQKYMAKVQNPIEPSAGKRNALLMAIAAIKQVVKNND